MGAADLIASEINETDPPLTLLSGARWRSAKLSD